VRFQTFLHVLTVAPMPVDVSEVARLFPVVCRLSLAQIRF